MHVDIGRKVKGRKSDQEFADDILCDADPVLYSFWAEKEREVLVRAITAYTAHKRYPEKITADDIFIFLSTTSFAKLGELLHLPASQLPDIIGGIMKRVHRE